jgi:hypothetical protein
LNIHIPHYRPFAYSVMYNLNGVACLASNPLSSEVSVAWFVFQTRSADETLVC